MDLDIKSLISKAVEAFGKDSGAKKEFEKNPLAALKKVLGIEIPDDIVNQLIDGVKAALAGKDAGGLLSKIKKLFGLGK